MFSTPEQWYPVPEWPYEVSSHARVRRSAGRYCGPHPKLCKPLYGKRDPWAKWYILSHGGQRWTVKAANLWAAVHRDNPTPEPTPEEEIWKPDPWEEMKYLEVSNLGRARDSRDGRILKPYRGKWGLMVVKIDSRGKQRKLQNVVAAAHLPGRPEGQYHAYLLDGNPENCAVTNLTWNRLGSSKPKPKKRGPMTPEQLRYLLWKKNHA